jgi:hypothetical protein
MAETAWLASLRSVVNRPAAVMTTSGLGVSLTTHFGHDAEAVPSLPTKAPSRSQHEIGIDPHHHRD